MFKSLPQLIIHSIIGVFIQLANPKMFNSKFNEQSQVVSPKLRMRCEFKWVEVKKQPNPHWKYSRLCLKETVSQCCITSQTPTTTSKEHDKLGAWWARVNQQATVAP